MKNLLQSNKHLDDLRHGLDNAGAKVSEDRLLRVDHRVILLTAFVLLAFVHSVALDLNGSSLSAWNSFIPQPGLEKTGLVVGHPQQVRSDEWLSFTPWTLSQVMHDFPVANPNVGSQEDTLLQSMPVKHFSALFRPQNWGYFFLGADRGFSFYWNFKVFGLLAGSFLLLMLLTRNHFWLSLAGAGWLFFSGFIQWWFSTTLPETMTSIFFAFAGLLYLLLARRKVTLVPAFILLVMAGLDFVCFFYPPFQVPLVYLMVALLVGFLIQDGRFRLLRENLWRRLLLVGSALGLGLAALIPFYLDAQGAIQAITSTVYPGRRVFTGGDTGLVRLFAAFTAVPANESDIPTIWGNASEASGFLLLFPVVFMAILKDGFLRVKKNPIIMATGAYLLVFTAWSLMQFPQIITRVTLLNYVPSTRAQAGLGTASIIICVVFLSRLRKSDFGGSFAVAGGLVVLGLLTIYSLMLEREAPGFFQNTRLVLMVAGFTAAAWALLSRRRVFFFLVIFVALAPNVLVNPIARGLSPITGKEVSQTAESINRSQPGAKWIGFGDRTLANFLKASGLDVVNGVKYSPDLKLMRPIDPQGQGEIFYNRYGDLIFLEPGVQPPPPSARPALQTTGAAGSPILYSLPADDSFVVTISPCASELAQMGITNFAFSYEPDLSRDSCLEPLAAFSDSKVWFYRRHGS